MALGALIGLVLVVGATVPFPASYLLLYPGEPRSLDRELSVDGARTFDDAGSVLLMTVRLSGPEPTGFELLRGWLDDDVEVVTEEEIFGDQDREENDRFNVALMDASQVVAAKVALERLGYAVPVEAYEVALTDPESPADGRLRRGDLIVAIDGAPVRDGVDLGEAVRSRQPDEPVTFTVDRARRGAGTETVTIETRAAPDGPYEGEAQVGVVTSSRYDFPVDVSFSTGEVGGPSAGLAFTLAILDELTQGELTGGGPVAVTGTIAADGTVGPIGGAGQKAAGAREAGARLFIVPTADVEEARKHAGDVRVVGVATLDEALDALRMAGGDQFEPPT